MRRKRTAVLGALGVAVGLTGPLVRATVSLDLTDFNDDVMREMDDTMKRLDSNIATRDPTSVAADAQSIRDGLKWAQDYFTKKGNVEDAVKWAKQGQDLADAVARSAQSSDFETSLTTYDSLVRTCRACHDAYKPPDI
ncbi:MAG TPA: hypothetical protein VGO18_35740 [Steroidobacteraceae bacterium]|jgi:cytochrome c556|nr:hypothetical protein [Steroidobacteraceae bacterium]